LFFESLTVIISETLLIIVSLFFILYFDPQGLIYLLIYFGLAALVYSSLTRSKSIYWGNKRLELDQKLSKLILETFGFIKEIIVNNSQNFFNKKFKQLNKSKYKYFSYRLTLDQIPRVYFEFITVVFLVFYTLYLTYSNEATDSIIIKLGILIAVSYKVMPALSKVAASYQTIKNTSSSLNIIFHEITTSKIDLSNKKVISEFNNQIQFNNLSFRHNEEGEYLIKNMNFRINKNEIIGIIGKSGKGKTTLLDIFSGLINNYSGNLLIDGVKVENKDQKWKPDIGYVSQNTFIFDDTIKNNVIVSRIGSQINENLFKESIKLSRLKEWIDSLDLKSNSQISQDGLNISGGQQQRIGIARALYRNSDILLFDEPTSSVDSTTESEIMDTIYNLKGKKTIIIISHKTSILDRCDRIIKL
jgi:HlyD family secretion protein